MLPRRLNFLNWPIRIKLTAIFLIAILLPVVVVTVPTISERVNSLRQQNEVRLDTLGPYEITNTNQTLEQIRTHLEAFITSPNDFTQLQDYFYKAPTSMSTEERQTLQSVVKTRAFRYRRTAPSLSRIRFIGTDGTVFLDLTEQPFALKETPANQIILNPESITAPTTISNVYADRVNHPSVDVIYTFKPTWAGASNNLIIGYIVFTHDLLLGRLDSELPDLYGALESYPRGNLDTHVYLLSPEGLLISPAPDHNYFDDVSNSDGFRAAQNGETGISTYRSSLLNIDVLGYHTTVHFADGPTVTYLIETPLNEINEQAFRQVVSTLLPIALGGTLLGLAAALMANLLIARPITRLTEAARQLSSGSLNVDLPDLERRDEIGILNNTFVDMSGQLLRAIVELESRVFERTRNLETTLEVGRVLTSIHDLDTLLEEVVNVIRDRFEQIYHVQVFMIDSQTNRATLRASTGAIGRRLLERGHYLDVGSQSVIGSVTASGHAVIALDTSHNPLHKRNEFLPDTRSEMALPLRTEGHVIGALDLQSTQPDAFSDQDVELFQGMADQITIAIESALLFAESNEHVQEIETLNRLLTRAAWNETVRGREQNAFSAASGQVAGNRWSTLQMEAMTTRQISARIDGDTVTFAVPVLLRGEVLGAVEWQVPEARYTASVRQTALELTTRLALTADNIRLFEQGRRQAQREFLVNQISSKLIGTTDIEQILQTTVRELGLALRLPQTAIQLVTPAANPAESSSSSSDE